MKEYAAQIRHCTRRARIVDMLSLFNAIRLKRRVLWALQIICVRKHTAAPAKRTVTTVQRFADKETELRWRGGGVGGGARTILHFVANTRNES